MSDKPVKSGRVALPHEPEWLRRADLKAGTELTIEELRLIKAADKAKSRVALPHDPSHELDAETRASMFIDWCALQGFGLEGWPEGSFAQLVAHIRVGGRTLRAEAKEIRHFILSLRSGLANSDVNPQAISTMDALRGVARNCERMAARLHELDPEWPLSSAKTGA